MYTPVVPVLLENDKKIWNMFAFSRTLKHFKIKNIQMFKQGYKKETYYRRLYINNVPE